MKLMKILLILCTVLAALAYGFLTIQQRFFTDAEPPVISFDSDTVTVSVLEDERALLEGVSATDRQDGDLSQSVMIQSVSQLITDNSAKVRYIVFDSADNMATASRTVVYEDYQKPRFALTKPLVYSVGSSITLQDRLSASDVLDGDLTSSIRLAAENLNSRVEGAYRISVMVTNSMGDTATLPLTILIRSTGDRDPVITLSEQLVYLEEGDDFDPEDYLSSVQADADSPVQHDCEDVNIQSDVDRNTAGVYEVTYTYENARGRSTTAILTVVVE